MREKVSAPTTIARLNCPALEEIVGDDQGVDEARADSLDVEGRALGDAEAGLDAHGGSGKGAVRRGGCAHHEIDVDRVDAGAHERLARGGDAEVGGQLAVLGDVALLDAGALLDPRVGGIDEARQIVIGHDALWQMGADAADHGSNECHVSPHRWLGPSFASGHRWHVSRASRRASRRLGPGPACRAAPPGPPPAAPAHCFGPCRSPLRWRWRTRRHRCRRGS